MTSQKNRCRWRVCPGCGHERRLARDAEVMCQHNRWDPAAWAMISCQGSGQLPLPDDPAAIAAASLALASAPPATSRADKPVPARQGAA